METDTMRRSRGPRHYFALSGFGREERKELCWKLASLRGDYTENAQYCSHIICKLPGRSEKFFLGCAMGKWVLTPQYILDSYSWGAWMEEDRYEWGPNSAPQLPPHMLPLLRAPHSWRVKLAKSHAGAFSNWRVTLFVKERSTEALFCRLLECGGAKVERAALPVGGRHGTGLTHVFHDETPGFARILEVFRQKGTPCLPLIYINDYLLQTGDMAPDRRRSHHGFVLTGFSRKERSELSLKIETLGGIYNESKEGIQKLQRDCSHIVCKLPARTEKFLMGCAMGKWILRVEYIHDSYHTGHWVEESPYEWGPKNAPEVPPSIRWMLTAPQRCRVKNATPRRGTFHGWRVAILVKHPQPKAVFKRLLECGGAKVEELRHPAAHSKLSMLTHIFHDGSMCFADMLRPYRQLGVPCLKPVYISDCLLGEAPPDTERYRTVDGVAVWPQLSPCSLFSSQSSALTVTSSSVTDSDVSPATLSPVTLSPVRPLASKDINTEMTVKTTASKTRRTPRPPRLPVRSVSQSAISGQDLLHRKKVVPSQPRGQSQHSSSDTELVRKTRSSRKQKPLQKGQTLLGNFCEVLRTPKTDHRNAARVLADLNSQNRGGHVTSKAGCQGQRSEVRGQLRQTKGMPVVVGKVLSREETGTEVAYQIQGQKTDSDEFGRAKQKMAIVGKVLTVVGKVVEKSSLQNMERVHNSSSHDVKANQKIPSQAKTTVQKIPSQAMTTVQKIPSQAMTTVQKIPSQTMKTAQKIPSQPMTTVQKIPSQPMTTVQKIPSQTMTTVQKIPSQPMTTVQKIPSQAMTTVQKIPLQTMTTVQKIPSQTMTTVQKIPSQAMTTVQKIPSQAMTTVQKIPSQTMTTVQKIPSQVIMTTVPKIPSQTMTTAQKIPSQPMTTVQKIPSQVIMTTVPKIPSQTMTTAQKIPSQPLTTVPKIPSQAMTTTVQKPSSQAMTTLQKIPSQAMTTTVEKTSSQAMTTVQKTLSQDIEIVQKQSRLDNDSARYSSGVYPMSPPWSLSQNTLTASSVVSPRKALVGSVPVRTPTKRKSPCVDEMDGTMAVPRKKQKECSPPALWSPFVKSTTEVKTKMCLPFAYPTCAMFEACLDDGELFYATEIVALSVSTTRYPPARLLHLILSRILLRSESAVLSHQVHRLLHAIVSEHPPTCPSMQCVYLDTVSYRDCDSAQTEHVHPSQFLFSVISTLLSGDLENPHSQNYLLCLEFVVSLFEKDFSISIQRRQLDGEDKKGGPWSSLIGQVFWPAGRRGHLNVACKQLLAFFARCLQLSTPYKAVLLRLLNRLVTMVAEHHRLADCAGRHPAKQTSLPHTAVMFARELAYRIQGTLTGTSAPEDSAGGVREAVGGLQLPWLNVHVCQTLLDLYDDTLLPASLQNPPLQITFSSIVSRYFYLLPRQRKAAMMDDIQPLDEESSMSQGTAQSDGQQKMTDSMYRTRGSKIAAKLVNSRNSKGETALHVACCSNNAVRVRELLGVPGIEINCQDHSGYTPLHQAAIRGHVECVVSLLKYKPTNSILSFLKCESVDGRPNGARLDVMTKAGATVLHAAVAENQLQVAHLLLQFGGKRLLRLRNSAGQIPLRVAVSEEMRQLLLDPQSPRKTSFCSSQDLQLSQSSHESSESLSQSDSTPPNDAYRDRLDSQTLVTRDECGNYVYLVCRLVLSYVKLHCLCHSRRSKTRHSMDQARSRLDISATNGDTDVEVSTCLHRHVSNFQTHLRRIIGGSTLEFCQLDLTALQTLAHTMK